MKIALFSDIHANLPALEAFFEDIEKTRPNAIYCLGDLVGYNIWPIEVVDEIRNSGIPTISGNHDVKVKGLITTMESLDEIGKNYAYHLVNNENRKYLLTLPVHIRIEFQLESLILNMVLAHGSLNSIEEYVLADTKESNLLEMMDKGNAQILCVGHSHTPFHRIINGNRHIINTGSVGKPKDGIPQGCHVLLTLGEDKNIGVEIVRFDYDIERAALAIEESLLPDEFADMLRKAY